MEEMESAVLWERKEMSKAEKNSGGVNEMKERPAVLSSCEQEWCIFLLG